jgi:RNA polymerase sigma-70 factor (subfamily 1)
MATARIEATERDEFYPALRVPEDAPTINWIVGSRPNSRLLNTLTLIRNAQDGDRSAFEALFERYYPRVSSIVRARAGSDLRRLIGTEDLLQNSMIEAIRSFENVQIRGEAGFIHWFAGIVQNRILAGRRDAGRDKRDPAREVVLEHIRRCMSTGSLNFEPAASEPLPVDHAVDREQEELVAECLHELKESHREVILLRCYAGASWTEVSDLLGSSTPDAARVLYNRATVELKKAVERRIRN